MRLAAAQPVLSTAAASFSLAPLYAPQLRPARRVFTAKMAAEVAALSARRVVIAPRKKTALTATTTAPAPKNATAAACQTAFAQVLRRVVKETTKTKVATPAPSAQSTLRQPLAPPAKTEVFAPDKTKYQAQEVVQAFSLQRGHKTGGKDKVRYTYLVDENMAKVVMAKLGPLNKKTVIEILPGPGILTTQLLQSNAKQVIAFEEARRFYQPLAALAARYPGRLQLVHGDLREFGSFDKIDEAMYQSLDKFKPVDWSKNPCASSVCLVGIVPELNGDLLLTRLLRQMCDRSGFYSWGRAPLTCLVPPVILKRLVAKPGEPNRTKLSILSELLLEPIREILTMDPSVVAPQKEGMKLVQLIPRQTTTVPVDDISSLEYVIRQLTVRKAIPLDESAKSLGPGGNSLLAKAGLSGQLRASEMDAAQFAKLTQAFCVWPDRPIAIDADTVSVSLNNIRGAEI